MTFSEKLTTINNKIEQNKAQCNLDRQTGKIWWGLWSHTKEVNEKVNKKSTLQKYNKSDLIYSSKFSFYKYYSIKRFNILFWVKIFIFIPV